MKNSFSFLFEMNRQGRPPSNPLLPSADDMNAITMASLFKPFKFGNLATLNRNWLIKQSSMKLNKISRLEQNLRMKLGTNPKNKNKIEIDIKFCQQAYKFHHEYTSKLIFWKSRSMMLMGPQVRQLQEQYSRQLFMLHQAYQRQTLGLNTANTQQY